MVEDRKFHQELDAVLLQYRLQLALVDLFNDERHGYHNVRLDFRKGLHDDLRARNPCQEMHMRTYAQFEEHLEHHPVHVC